MSIKNNSLTKKLPVKMVVNLVLMAILAFLPKFLAAVYPGIYLFVTLSQAPYWYIYLVFLVALATFIDKRFGLNKP